MQVKDRNALKFILEHKEHFDQKLLDIVDHLVKNEEKLKNKINSLDDRNKQLDKSNKSLINKINDLKAKFFNLNKSYKEALEKIDFYIDALKKKQDEIKKLKDRIEELEKENKKYRKDIEKKEKTIDKYMHQNSTNSNIPSSYDILSKSKAPVNSREATGNKRGGQVNHPLHKSSLSSDVKRVIIRKVKKAPTGAEPVKDEDGNVLYYVTQEVDLVLKSEITETRYYVDPQGEKLDKKTMKKYAINPVVYSPRFKAIVVYLNQKGTIPLQRLSDMMSDISRGIIQLKPSTITSWCQECYKKSEELLRMIIDDILKENIVHVDETGVKISGKNRWMHVITNEKGSYYICTEKRGDSEKGPLSLLAFFIGVLVHDHFSSYQKLKLCRHAECNAHIDRYLKAGIDFEKSEDCKKMIELLHEMLRRKHELMEQGKDHMDKEEIENFENRYVEILTNSLEEYAKAHPKIKKRDEDDYIKTFRRMLEYKEDHLRFMKEFEVPYTNNRAELGCRVVKGHKNSSHQFVTMNGGDTYAGLTSIIETAKIRKENAIEKLEEIFSN